MIGWITLHRKIEENELWLAEPFTKGQAWVDLILIANHKDTILWKRGIRIVIKRGEVGWSEVALAKRWKWSRDKVRNFLKYLKTIQQIKRESNHTLSRIIIVNYNKYQLNQTTDQTTDQTVNNNVNNDNNNLGDKSPEKDMSWNKQSDDYEEGTIDLDDSTLLKEEKKTATKKYPNAPAIRKIFQEVLGRNPSNWKINKTQLLACENLFTERTPEKVRSALEFYKENEGKEFCPVINSPYDLDTKWTNLGQFKLKV